VSVASRPSTRASKLPVTQLVFVARGAFPRSTPCVCALRGFLPGRVFPDRTTRRHGLARPPPKWVGWAERAVTLSAFSSRSFRLVGVAERLRAVASDSLEPSLGEDPREGDGGPGVPWPSSEEDVSVALELSSSDDVGFDPEAESSEDEEGTALAGSSLRTDLPLVTLLVFLTFLVLSPD